MSFLFGKPRASASQFGLEARYKEAVRRNPAGVRLTLRTRDGRHAFHLYETIPIEMEYSADRPSAYSIELDESMNAAGKKLKFQAEPGESILLPFGQAGSQVFTCCGSQRRYLSARPTIFERELTDYMRFEKAGTYRLYVTTSRVFSGPGKKGDFGAGDTPLTSNILTLTILPDDPGWDARRLVQTLQKVFDPLVKANYLALKQAIQKIPSDTGQDIARANRLNQTEFVSAEKALNALDTQAAIRERVKLMNMSSNEEIRAERQLGLGEILPQPLLKSSARPDLLVAAMEERAAESNFAPDYDFVYWWAQYALIRDHKDLFRPFTDESEWQAKLPSLNKYDLAEKRAILLQLNSFAASKRGPARELTALTISILKADIDRPVGSGASGQSGR